MTNITLFTILGLLVFSASNSASAWSASGHRIVGMIAERELLRTNSQKTLAEIRNLLDHDVPDSPAVICGEEPKGTGTFYKAESLAAIATYADEVRAQPAGLGSEGWHFTNAPYAAEQFTDDLCQNPEKLNFRYNKRKKCYDRLSSTNPDPELRKPDLRPAKRNCSLLKTEELLKAVASTKLKDVVRLKALKFLVHVVGDAHQPLHNVGWSYDAGGNGRVVSFFNDEDPSYGPLNLHSIWDSNILERRMWTLFHKGEEKAYDENHGDHSILYPTFQSHEEARLAMAKYLHQSTTQNDFNNFLRFSWESWLWHAHTLAVDVAYRGFKEKDTLPKDLRQNWPESKGEVDKLRTKISKKYYDESAAVIEDQLAKAGVRLAGLLSKAFESP